MSEAGSRAFKLLIGIPSGNEWGRLFGMSLAMLIGELSSKPVLNYPLTEVKIDNHLGSILSRSREKLTNIALARGVSHMLFLDADMTFQPDVVHRLAAHKKWVVAANCATKTVPASTTARLKGPTPAGQQVFSDPNKQGLEKVWRVGTGIMLIDMRVFTKIKKPWFPIVYRPEIDDYQGEDWSFCEKLEQVGIAIYVDHDVSRGVGHCGSFVYGHNVVGEIVKEEVKDEGPRQLTLVK